MSSSDSNSDSEWSDIDDSGEEIANGEEEEEATKVQCLFTTQTFTSVDELFTHMKTHYNINFKQLLHKLNLDFYNYIKFINYLRKTKPTPETLNNLDVSIFSGDEWLMPVIEDDLLLQYDIEALSLEDEEAPSEVEVLKMKLVVSEERARLAEEFLERTIDDLNKCRKELNALLLGGVGSGRSKGGKALPKLVEGNGHCDELEEEDHEGYFSSYAHYGIHEEMIKDKVRTESYRSFILNNPGIFKGSRVLDVGCGTSILSMFSAEAGAKEVIGVDNSEIAYQAMDVVLENKLNKIINIQKGKAEDLKIEGKVDVIISEWMGYFLLFESMLDTVIYCRDNYLSESGCIYPDKCNISLVALDDADLYNNKVKFWGDVYGYKMGAMRKSVIEEPLIAVVKQEKVISKPHVLQEFHLMKVSVAQLEFEAPFSLQILQDGEISALVGYFDCDFETKAEQPVRFSTSPFDTPTHWKQTVFFFKEVIAVKEDEVINGRLKCRKNKQDSRSLDVTIDILKDETVVYHQKYCMG